MDRACLAPSLFDCVQVSDDQTSEFKELEQVGCFYKDWNFTLGLVDFPAIIAGKEVLLCWRSDEPEVRFYHTQEDGYTGRRPIPEELLVEKS